jgi:hypothetical protein
MEDVDVAAEIEMMAKMEEAMVGHTAEVEADHRDEVVKAGKEACILGTILLRNGTV